MHVTEEHREPSLSTPFPRPQGLLSLAYVYLEGSFGVAKSLSGTSCTHSTRATLHYLAYLGCSALWEQSGLILPLVFQGQGVLLFGRRLGHNLAQM